MQFYCFAYTFVYRRVGLYRDIDVEGTGVITEYEETKENMTQYSKNT